MVAFLKHFFAELFIGTVFENKTLEGRSFTELQKHVVGVLPK